MLQRYSEHQLILMYFDSHDDVVLSLPPVLILLTLAAAAFQSRAVNLKFMSLLALAFRRELRNVLRPTCIPIPAVTFEYIETMRA